MDMWKQYLRIIPAYLGLFNKGAFLYQIDTILPDDIFIVSYPKSGNTWVRFIVASFFYALKDINNRSIDLLIPDVYRNKKEINTLKRNRIIKSHNAYFSYHPKTVYIVRDYRAVVVSYFYYLQSVKATDKITLEEFLKNESLKKPFGAWAAHVRKALAFQKKHPEKILLVKYEDLLDRRVEVLERLFKFCNGKIVLPSETIYEAFSFEALKKDENVNGNYFTDHTQQSFYRKGIKDDWKNQLSQEQIDLIVSDEKTKKVMEYFNYI